MLALAGKVYTSRYPLLANVWDDFGYCSERCGRDRNRVKGTSNNQQIAEALQT